MSVWLRVRNGKVGRILSHRIDEKEFYGLLESVVIEDEEKNSHPRQKGKAEI
jgi:hypothetical protein